ncbi:hypothetical protein MH138_10045 [Bacillus safensis]|uniref:hypothetical protein n=1 Tax=Bacillus TaxID=1386 RepID=UPI0011A2CF8C|nr:MULTISPECIES: hypothetical protein [Bacillus]MCY7583457.1 hypothetical protein [Bacillus safensis]MCY7587899.1 hypothetical protein [Bacillus safensis]
MKKKLLLVPVISLGLFSGITGSVSAAETENYNQNQTHSTIMNTSSSIHDQAFELKNRSNVVYSTNKYNPIRYFKFYFDGNSDLGVILKSEHSHKMSILNGNFIQVGSDFHNFVLAENLTYGWNYIEVVDTKPLIKASYFNLIIDWI